MKVAAMLKARSDKLDKLASRLSKLTLVAAPTLGVGFLNEVCIINYLALINYLIRKKVER